MNTVNDPNHGISRIYKDSLDYTEGSPLTDAEVKERLKNTPKTDVEELLQQGFMEGEEFCYLLENGFIQP